MHSQMEYKVHGNKFERLQAKIRKSEMERQELECRFENLMRSSNECEKTSLKVLRAEYKKFMDEERQRAERNENLLQTLDRIDFQAAALAAKTERLRLLKSQYKSLLLKNWMGDSGSRIVSHRSNISSPQEFHPMRYPRMPSPVYHYQQHQPAHGGYWSDGETSVRNAPQIRDMEIQTSLTMLNTPMSSSFLNTTAPPSGIQPPPSPHRVKSPSANHDAKSPASSANHPTSLEEEPELNKTLLNSATSPITTSQSDYYLNPKCDEPQTPAGATSVLGETLMNEEDSQQSPQEPQTPFYLREVQENTEEKMNGRKIEECHSSHENAEDPAPRTIDSGQNEIGEQLGNLSTTPTRKPPTSSLRHALLKNTKLTVGSPHSTEASTERSKVVKKVEFCLDQNEAHEDTKSQWNDNPDPEASAHMEDDTDDEPPHSYGDRRYSTSQQYQPTHEIIPRPYQTVYNEDEESDDAAEELRSASDMQEECTDREEEVDPGQQEYDQAEYTQQAEGYHQQEYQQPTEQYPEVVQETQQYYGDENVQQGVDENTYAAESSYSGGGEYEVQDVGASTPSTTAHLLTQETIVEQSESPYQQFISPDGNIQGGDTYQDGGFTAPSDYLEMSQQPSQDFGNTNEIYQQQYDPTGVINQQQVEYGGVEYDATQSQVYDPNQEVMAYEQNYGTYSATGQDVHYPPDAGAAQTGYEQSYSDANYAEGGYTTETTVGSGGGEYGQQEGVYLSEHMDTQQMYHQNYPGSDQYTTQQEDPGDYYNLSEQQQLQTHQEGTHMQTFHVENANPQVTSSPQTTYSDDLSSNFAPIIADPTLDDTPHRQDDTPAKPSPKSTNFLDSSSSESEPRRQKVKFADEKMPADESDFDFSSHDK
ncbi:hypothetical protein DMENIID0001_087280 [Sergentomyia squamirostris]